MPNEGGPVRRDLFDLYREQVSGRFDRIDQDMRDLRKQHEDDMKELAEREESKGRWTWQKITAAIGAAAALGGLWYQALSR